MIIDRHSKLGLTGPFQALFGARTTYLASVVSIAAQLFAIEGHFQPSATVAAEAWTSCVSGLGARLEDENALRQAVLHEFGTPSFSVRRRRL